MQGKVPSTLLAWKIPWTEEPGRLQSMGSLRVGHDSATSLSPFTFMHWRGKWHPTPVSLPGEFQGQQCLVGCRLWGHTESDTTEATQQQQQGKVSDGVNLKSIHPFTLRIAVKPFALEWALKTQRSVTTNTDTVASCQLFSRFNLPIFPSIHSCALTPTFPRFFVVVAIINDHVSKLWLVG